MHHLHTIFFVLVLFWKARVSRMHTLTCKETGKFVVVEKEQGKLFSCSQSERQMAELVSSGYWDRVCSVFISAVAKTMYLSVALTRNTKSPRLSGWPHVTTLPEILRQDVDAYRKPGMCMANQAQSFCGKSNVSCMYSQSFWPQAFCAKA